MFQKRKEMEIISRALEDLINGKTLEIALPNQDTLPAKVQHQLVRLSDIIRGTQEKAWKERNQIKELIAETAHQLRNPLANMESYLELLQEEELCVSHDAKWLGEAVYNLLDNSVKYSPNGSKIEIKISKNEMFAQIVVRDFGVGIEHEELNLIFQRFYRGKRAENQPGFGLGLYLAREIVLQHGGFMKAKEKEKGLEISIFLPV